MTPKSTLIIHEARQELMNFISFQAQSIINRRIEIGEEDPIDPNEGGDYEIRLDDYNINQVFVDVAVMDTYSLETYDEHRKVEAVLLDSSDNEVYLVVEGMDLDVEDPIHIRALSTDDIKFVGCALEEAYAELCEEAPVMQ